MRYRLIKVLQHEMSQVLDMRKSLQSHGIHQDQEQLMHKSHTHQQTQTQQDTHRNTAPTLAHNLRSNKMIIEHR